MLLHARNQKYIIQNNTSNDSLFLELSCTNVIKSLQDAVADTYQGANFNTTTTKQGCTVQERDTLILEETQSLNIRTDSGLVNYLTLQLLD